MSTLLELVAFAALMTFGFLAAGWVGAALILVAVVLLAISFRLDP